ncbi:MAG: MotA/TolQ/ExbB proton channel family protein [Desulfosarcina sp.]|nr:MotA/TolQ/ExbB proton channel family protein [Desulfosarcina sp.]MBC2744429.1 MotA/TolQ/ExbB proton channel family protein [Desulfosarcina sp.]MBC2767337.1 MotA/TolQ/ExbB proton channel family protein [Desulfosarcina sp.]
MIDIFNSGGPVMVPLLLCSLLSLTVIIERGIFWTIVGMRSSQPLVNEVMELCQVGNWEGVRKIADGSKSYVIRILISGILHRNYSMVKAMESAAADEIARMRRYMGVLDTIITVSPLLGIFGTVIGIIGSFDMLGAGGIDHPELVTRGIAQALITTASGLGIAILTVFPFNYFNARIERAARFIEKYATSLEIIYEKIADKNGSAVEADHEG